MQEQIDREAIGITLKASRLTARVLAAALRAALEKIQREHRDAQTPRGKQSVRTLMNHNQATNTIPVEGDMGLFDKIARKWNVDYAFHKTGPKKYLLLFKSAQADAVTAAFGEYSALAIKRASDRRLPIMQRLRLAANRAERERPKHRERKREREAVRE